MKLENKTAVVTGGAAGIGRAISICLAGEGANVVVADIDIASASKVAAEIQESGGKALAVRVDVASSEDAGRMIATAVSEFGAIDILINCAGGPNPARQLFVESNEQDWDHVLNINLKGTRNCSRAVINQMVERKRGKIVNIASLAGILGDYGDVDYSAAKAGIIGFTMALAKEVAQYGINVNCISPGPILTPAMESHMSPENIRKLGVTTGMGRIGKPEEIAALVLFLVSDDADFITGQNYPICGLRNLGAVIQLS